MPGLWWRYFRECGNYDAWRWVSLTSLTPPSPAVEVQTPLNVEVKAAPAEVKTEPDHAEQQWYKEGNAEPVEGYDDADYDEEVKADEPDDEEGNVEPVYRSPSPITPDGIEEGKVEPVNRRPAPAPRGPPPKKRRTGPALFGPGGPAFGADTEGRPEEKPRNYYGCDFENPSQRLSRIRISRGKTEPRSWVKIAKVCKFWYEYCCTNGDFCTYAHARDELGKYIRCAPRSPLPSTRRRRRR